MPITAAVIVVAVAVQIWHVLGVVTVRHTWRIWSVYAQDAVVDDGHFRRLEALVLAIVLALALGKAFGGPLAVIRNELGEPWRQMVDTGEVSRPEI